MLPLVFLIAYMGLFPGSFFRHMEPSLREFTKKVTAPAAEETAAFGKVLTNAKYN
jgi:hypothetical protein